MSALAAHRLEEAAKAPARSRLLGTLVRSAIGPFTARRAEGGLVAWIAGAERGGGEEVVVVATGPDGAPLNAPSVVASFPQEATSLVVRAAGTGHPGWLVAYSTLLDRGESLAIVGLTADGKPRGKPMDVQRTGDHLKWADIVPTTRGAVCVWAEETPAGEANVLTVSVDSDGKPRSMPMRVARGVIGWGAVAADDGVGLAVLTAAAPETDTTAGAPQRAGKRRDRTTAGALAWMRLDAEGRPMGAPVSVGPGSMVSGDVDVGRVRDGFLLAWTDRTGEDPRVALALVDKTGRVRGPVRALQALGGSMLAGLAAGDAGAMLAWEEPRGLARPERALHLASVTTGDVLAAEPVLSLEVAAAPPPELAATRDGFALVALARNCAGPSGSARPCRGPLQPTFLRLDSRLAPVQAEPMFVGDPPDRAVAGWGLLCVGDPCVALAASGDTPTPVYTVNLERRTSPFAPPVMRPPPSDAPLLTGLSTIASGKAYADLVAARLGQETFVASMATGSTPAGGPRDRSRSTRGTATVTLARVDDAGQALSAPATVTSRALAAGGLALSAGERPEDGVALGWVARDEGGASHVHLARFDAAGQSRGLADVQLTTARGDASDVALAWAGNGWLVAWVDSRDGNGEVYAARVDRALHRVSREERITRAPGDASDVSLSVAGDLAWVAWSDARESPREGVADVYVTTLRTRDAQRAGDETRVLATAGHSRSPALAATDDGAGAIVAWIEDAPPGVDAPGAAMAAWVDAKAHVTGAPSRIELAADGKPTNVALQLAPVGGAPGAEGRERGVRAVIARTWRDEVTLDATWLPARQSEPLAPAWPLVDLDAPGSFDVVLAPAGDVLFFDDIGVAAPTATVDALPYGTANRTHRVRRAVVDWRR